MGTNGHEFKQMEITSFCGVGVREYHLLMATTDTGCAVCLREEGVERRTINSAVPYNTDAGFENRSHSDSGFSISCPACGEFVVSYQDDVNLKSARHRSKWSAAHLSALLREQTIRPLPRFWLQYGMDPYGPLERTDLAPVDLNELLARWPRSVPERIDRALCNIARLSPTGGHEITIDNNETALLFAETRVESHFTTSALIDYKLLGVVSRNSRCSVVFVTPEGWARFEELTRGASAPENNVFVAMWYGGTDEEKSKMTEAFEHAIKPAIVQAGYRATRVDLAEHNDWIMDKVLGDIRIAPFVVADFTGNRNGVYLEAGFARGLRIPVIHTCREDHFKDAHFDTKQLNHILWNTPGELQKKLYNRIVGTIGRGPHPQPDACG